MKDYEYIRTLLPPITKTQLRPLDSVCEVVQFISPLTEKEHKKVAGFLRDYPEVTFRVFGHNTENCDLEFLKHYPFLRRFQVDVWDLKSVYGLCHLPDDLEYFGFGQTRSKRFSLSILERFSRLRELFIESHRKDIDVISGLNSLQELTLRSITLPDLSILKPLKKLRSLDLKLGGTKDLSLLPEIGRLRYLEIWMVKGLSDLSHIGKIGSLQYLFLQAIKNVQELPSLAGLKKLRRIQIDTMKGISDLRNIARAQNLEELFMYDMPHLQPEAFRPFANHPKLKCADVSLGSERKNQAVEELLGLPKSDNSRDSFKFR